MNELMEKREIAFPIAAITAAVYLLFNTVFRVAQYHSYAMSAYFLQDLVVLQYIGWICTIAALFLRKRKFLIINPFVIMILRNIVGIMSAIRDACLYPGNSGVWPAIGGNFFELVCFALLIVFVVFQDWDVNPGVTAIFKNLWFIPGIVALISNIILNRYLFWGNFFTKFMGVLSIIVYVSTIVLIGVWLMHPYARQAHNQGFGGRNPQMRQPGFGGMNPQGEQQNPGFGGRNPQMRQPGFGGMNPQGKQQNPGFGGMNPQEEKPVSGVDEMNPQEEKPIFGSDEMNPQQQHQKMEAVDRLARQTSFCTGCGKELQPNENFCTTCGTKRPN